MLQNLCTAPQLNTVFVEPLKQLERLLLQNREEIKTWLQKQWEKTPPPVYGSVDLRNAGFKLAPVDMNLFPGGFNNLNPALFAHAIEAAREVLLRAVPDAKKILLLPENHIRNPHYWENIKVLHHILTEAGFSVRIGILAQDMHEPRTIPLADGGQLVVEPVLVQDHFLVVADFKADFILLNNDLSEGMPQVFKNLAQPVLPPAQLGWQSRLKSEHFSYYDAVCTEFAAHFNLDPWLIAPYFQHCGHIDFMKQEGLDCLFHHVDSLFKRIQKKYAEYGIAHKPFLIVKADAGTYGMAVMTVRDPNELKNLNRKQRTRMAATKGGKPVNRVIIQEGVYTFETVGENQNVAEPVIYLLGEHVVGGFYRVHQERGTDENLNTPGMRFEPLPFSTECNAPCLEMAPDACENRFFVYGIIARLSMLAAAREMLALEKG